MGDILEKYRNKVFFLFLKQWYSIKSHYLLGTKKMITIIFIEIKKKIWSIRNNMIVIENLFSLAT